MAMLIVWCVAACWAKVTHSYTDRKLHHVFILSILVSAHLNAAWILPEDVRNWFLTNASIPFVILNALSITLGGYLLNSEQKRIAKEGRIAASTMYDPDHGAWAKPAFEREVKLRVNAGTMETPAGLLIVRIRHSNFLYSMVPNFWHDKILGLLHMRLKDAYQGADLAFSIGASSLAIPLSSDQYGQNNELEQTTKRLMESDKFQFYADMKKLIIVDVEAIEWAVDQTLDEVIGRAKIGVLKNRKVHQSETSIGEAHVGLTKKKNREKVRPSKDMPRTNNEALFGKASFLMNLNRVS